MRQDLERALAKFRGPVRAVVTVPDFVCEDFTFGYSLLKSTYAEMLIQALDQNIPGARLYILRKRKVFKTIVSRQAEHNLTPDEYAKIKEIQTWASDAAVVKAMFEKGIRGLTGKNLKKSFGLFFTKGDVIGLKVNPVGPGLISTRLEVVDAMIDWLTSCGVPRKNIIIWDRFDYMLKDAGFTTERYPGIGIEGLQTMDEAAAEGKTQDNSRWLKADGTHISAPNFDQEVFYSEGYYWARQDAEWYHARDPHGSWYRVERGRISPRLAQLPPGRYRNWRGDDGGRNDREDERHSGREGNRD